MRALGAPGPSDKSRPAMVGAQPARNARAGATHGRQVCARASRTTVEPPAAISRRAGRNPPHLLRVPDGDRDAVRGHDEAEAEEGHEAEAGIDKCRGRDDTDCEAYRRRQVVCPSRARRTGRGPRGPSRSRPRRARRRSRGCTAESTGRSRARPPPARGPPAIRSAARRSSPAAARCPRETSSRCRRCRSGSTARARAARRSGTPVAIQATRRENSRATSWKFRHAYTAAQRERHRLERDHARPARRETPRPPGTPRARPCSAGPRGTAEIRR